MDLQFRHNDKQVGSGASLYFKIITVVIRLGNVREL